MQFLKDFINQTISFLKDEQEMDKLDYLVYGSILIVSLLFIKKTQPTICILKINFAQILYLTKVIGMFLLASTFSFNFYKTIKNNYF